MKRRNRQNIPIYMVLAAVVMIVLVIALGSLGGDGETPLGDIFPGSPEPSIESTPTVLSTVEIPPEMLATPSSPGKVLPVVEDPDTGLKYVNGDVIVMFSPGIVVDLSTGLTNSNEVNTYLESLQIDSVDSLALLPEGISLEHVPGINQIFKYTFPKGTDIVRLSEELSLLPEIEFATLNGVGEISQADSERKFISRNVSRLPQTSLQNYITPNDPCYSGNCDICRDVSGQWVMNDTWSVKLGVPDAWQITTGSDQVVVAVIDSGLYILHPDLREKYAGNGYNFLENNRFILDDKGHGTGVSGIIAAVADNGQGIAGMSWGARIMPLKVTDRHDNWADWGMTDAILWAVEKRADVINISLIQNFTGGPFGRRMVWAIALDYAYSEGVTVVASAGNGSQELTSNDDIVYAPAEMDHVIVVGATNEDDENCHPLPGIINYTFGRFFNNNCGWTKDKVSANPPPPGSGHGPALDVMAPGSANICTTQPLWDFKEDKPQEGYKNNFGGTSASAPFVSGLAALMLSVNPDLTPDEIERIIKETAYHLGEEGDHVCGAITRGNDTYGCGRIDVYAAVNKVPPPQPPPIASAGNSATMLVMDVSGSMSANWQGGIKIESAKSAADQVVNMLQQESQAGSISHRVGLATFTNHAALPLGLSADYDLAHEIITRLGPQGGTNLGAGLIEANSALTQAGAGESKIIILLSDGLTNDGLSPSGILSGPVQDAVSAGTCIYTVGFGDRGNLDEVLLDQIAAASGCGEYSYAALGTNLESVYIRVRHVSTGNMLAEFNGTVAQGQTVEAGTFDVPSGQGVLAVTLHWPGSALDLQLKDPRGRTVDEKYRGATIETYENLVYALIDGPQSGTWVASVYGREVPQGTTNFDAMISARAGAVVAPGSSSGAGIAVLLLAIVGGGVAVFTLAQRRKGPKRARAATKSEAATASLAITAGPFAGLNQPITSKGLLIGRGTGCNLRLRDSSASRQHARIRFADGAWFIQDLGSAGGTSINGQQVQASRLTAGDQIQIGNSTIVFQVHPK